MRSNEKRMMKNHKGDIINVSHKRNDHLGGITCDYLLYFVKLRK
jgi:hypothetical protein